MSRPKARTLPAAAALLLPLLVSCASPGPPRPPSLNLAEPPADLTAERAGNRVLLHWTTSSDTTDGLDLKGPLTAEICRQTAPPASTPTAAKTPCPPVQTVPIQPGPSTASDPLPANLTTGQPTLLTYHVRIRNSAGRSAAPSNPAFAASGPAPAPIATLRATAFRGGAALEWTPAGAPADHVELTRTLLSPTPAAPAKPQQPAAKSPVKSATKSSTKSPLDLSQSEPATVRLSSGTSDPGGLRDRTAHKSQTYTWQAQRIRTVTLAGHTLQLRSEPSPTATLRLADTFPPAIPANLAAVPGDAPHTIDLVWDPVPDSDLAGYNLYRRAPGAPQPQRLNEKPIPAPAFTDPAAAPGHPWLYSVTSIDSTGNESPRSAEVRESAQPATPTPPPPPQENRP